MKQISASIIVLSGTILVASGAHVAHNDTQAFVMILGCVVGLIGLSAWFTASRGS